MHKCMYIHKFSDTKVRDYACMYAVDNKDRYYACTRLIRTAIMRVRTQLIIMTQLCTYAVDKDRDYACTYAVDIKDRDYACSYAVDNNDPIMHVRSR